MNPHAESASLEGPGADRPPGRRRRRSRRSTRIWIPVAVVVAGGIAAYAWMGMSRPADAFPGLRVLDLAAYTERPFTLRGETFTLRGKVSRTLASSPSSADRIVLVTVAGDLPGAEEPLPLKVPAAWISRMQAGREMVFKVLVSEGGILVVEDLVEV